MPAAGRRDDEARGSRGFPRCRQSPGGLGVARTICSMNVLVFGATGSAGGSVLRASLSSPLVCEVRAIVRRPLPLAHAKLRTLVHGDYLDYTAVADAFVAVDACLFCLGVSATQVSGEEAYRAVTHDLTLAAARALRAYSPAAAFHYISGQGTNPASRFMWARVKAQTERELIEQFGAVCWRPAVIDGERSASAPRLVPGSATAVPAPEAVPEPLRHGRGSRPGDAAGHRRDDARLHPRERPDPRRRPPRPAIVGGAGPSAGAITAGRACPPGSCGSTARRSAPRTRSGRSAGRSSRPRR